MSLIYIIMLDQCVGMHDQSVGMFDLFQSFQFEWLNFYDNLVAAIADYGTCPYASERVKDVPLLE